MAYTILTAGYNGSVVPLVFEPPATVRALQSPPANTTGKSPSWITARNDGSGIIYVTSEDERGLLFVAEAIGDPGDHDGSLRLVGDKDGYSTGGDGPVASCVVGSHVYVANYNSGSASVLALQGHGSAENVPASPKPASVLQFSRPDGKSGPVASRQDHSYAHDVVASPDGGWVYVPDLGADQIHHIRTPEHGPNAQAEHTTSTSVAAGSGPRHLAFYRADDGAQYAYLTSELASTLTAFHHDPHTGKLDRIGEPVLSVPAGTPLGGNATAGPDRSVAELAISPDGRFVYVSDRGDAMEDHITVFARDARTGSIEYVEWIPAGGKNTRHFSLSADGKYLALANQNTGNVVVFSRDADSGHLTSTGAIATDLGQVAFAGFLPAMHFRHDK